MNIDRSVIKRAKQLKALMEKGEGGEKHNARALYEKHLKKHGITEEQLGLNMLQFHYFKYDKGQQPMLSMIMCHVVANALIMTDPKKKSILFMKCSNIEAAKVRVMFKFYIDAYRVEEEYFLTAFLHRNELTPKIVHQEGEQKKAVVNIKNETDESFEVKVAPAPAESIEYTPSEQRKIKGLMSWMKRYEMAENALNENT